jgi:hypothetical protein
MARLGGADEAVVGAVHPVGHRLEPGGGAVDEGARRGAGPGRGLLDLQPVLVGAGGEQHIVAVEPVKARDGVGGDHLVGMADMGRAVGVGDRGRKAEGLSGIRRGVGRHVCGVPDERGKLPALSRGRSRDATVAARGTGAIASSAGPGGGGISVLSRHA